MDIEKIKVSSNTDIGKLASCISVVLDKKKNLEIVAMGRNANYKIIKAIIIARDFCKKNGISDFNATQEFEKKQGDNTQVSIKWTITV